MLYLHFKAYKKIIIKGAELTIKVCSVIKKKKKKKRKKRKEKEKKRKERKEKNNQKISTRFVISTNNLIIWSYSTKNMSGYLKDDANLLTYPEM